MIPKILFRSTLAEEGELEIARQYFDIIESRAKVSRGEYIIGRYSVLPYYTELENDIATLGGLLVNSFSQHQHVADLQNWYPSLEHLTPKTWFRLADVPLDQPGSFILKGAVNSRKQLWRTHMFAKNRKDVLDVYFKLMDDSLLQHQGIYVREFVNLVNCGNSVITGCPISKEFRIFVYNKQILAKGYYWSIHSDEAGNPDPNEIPQPLLQEVVNAVGDDCMFWIFDVAQKTNGEWIVVELGDAQMGGLSCINPHELYSNLRRQVDLYLG